MKYSADGKGNIKINGNTVTAGMLKTVSQHLVDVYGQSEHFALLSEANQLSVIDELCGERAADIKNALSILISEKRECLRRLKQLGGDSAERARRLDLLSYQIKEIDAAELRDGEEEELIAKRRIIENTEKIASAVSGSLGAINCDGGVSDGISAARRLMANVSEYGDDYSSVSDRLDAVLAELQDIADMLSDMADGLEFDEADARRVEDRLDLIRNLKKKYGATVEEILAFRAKAGEEYDLLSDSEAVAEKLTKRLEELDERLRKAFIAQNKGGKVLVEEKEVDFYVGYSENYIKCYIDSDQDITNQVIEVEFEKPYLEGEKVKIKQN